VRLQAYLNVDPPRGDARVDTLQESDILQDRHLAAIRDLEASVELLRREQADLCRNLAAERSARKGPYITLYFREVAIIIINNNYNLPSPELAEQLVEQNREHEEDIALMRSCARHVP
jgi:hypothetical protein